MVTPLGICLNCYEQSNNFIFVSFNGQRVKIYDNNRLAVVDAAMQAQFPNDALFPRRGKALSFHLNGNSRMVRGLAGEAAVITVNGELADIHAPIHGNDVIVVKESTIGEPGRMTLGELKELRASISIWVNEQEVELPKPALVNGVFQLPFYEIQENDNIESQGFYTVSQIAASMDVVLEEEMAIYVNNKLADEDSPVYENFSVVWTLAELSLSDLDKIKRKARRPGRAKGPGDVVSLTVTVNGDEVTLSGKAAYVFVDVFEAVDFDLNSARGRHIATRINGRDAQFMEPLHEGDIIEIFWR